MSHEPTDETTPPDSAPLPLQDDVSTLVVMLLRGIVYREIDERLWGRLLHLQARVREYVSVLGLHLLLDEAEGYSFLRSKADAHENTIDSSHETQLQMPRLVARRPLSFPVSLLLALLRRKLAEFDASGGGNGGRLVLSREQITELAQVFAMDSSNEAKLVDQIDVQISKVVDLGFLRHLKATEGPAHYEVRRILKAFVDAQWLAEFDDKLQSYRNHLEGIASNSEVEND